MSLSNLTQYLIEKRTSCSNNTYKNRKGLVEKHKHACAIFNGPPSKANILTIGYNKYDINGITTIHAEINALDKYYRCKRYSMRNKISILIIRTNGGNSRPCMHCINTMMKGHMGKIKNVYYTNGDTITKETFSSLKANSDEHISLCNRAKMGLL